MRQHGETQYDVDPKKVQAGKDKLLKKQKKVKPLPKIGFKKLKGPG